MDRLPEKTYHVTGSFQSAKPSTRKERKVEQTKVKALAVENMKALRWRRYPGRGIVVGVNDAGTHLIQAYFLMGRSEGSRNRVLECDTATNRVYTTPADGSGVVGNRSLTLYNAMLEAGDFFVVSNGNHTDTVATELRRGLDVQASLRNVVFEPDAPHFTPRIVAVSRLGMGSATLEMAIVRKSRWDETPELQLNRYGRVENGLGLCLTTYTGDEDVGPTDPLPMFRGEPYLLPLSGDPQEVTASLWDVLDLENRVSLAVKFVPMNSGPSLVRLVNKYEKKQ